MNIEKRPKSPWYFSNKDDRALFQKIEISLPGELSEVFKIEYIHRGLARFKINKDHSSYDSSFLKSLFDYGKIHEVQRTSKNGKVVIESMGLENIAKILGLIAVREELFINFSLVNDIFLKIKDVEMPKIKENFGVIGLAPKKTGLGRLIGVFLGFLDKGNKGVCLQYGMNDWNDREILMQKLNRIPGVYCEEQSSWESNYCGLVELRTDDERMFFIKHRRMIIESVEEVLELVDKYLPFGKEYWNYLKDGLSCFNRRKKILDWNIGKFDWNSKEGALFMWSSSEDSSIGEITILKKSDGSGKLVVSKSSLKVMDLMEKIKKDCHESLIKSSYNYCCSFHNGIRLKFNNIKEIYKVIELINAMEPMGEDVMFELKECLS